MSNTQEIKKILRKSILQKRKLLSPEELAERNARVANNVLAVLNRLKNIQALHVFLPIAKNNEVDTWQIIPKLKALELEVVISSTDFKKKTMEHFYLDPGLEFSPDNFGIPTPKGGRQAQLAEVDGILVPLLAADKKGGRIGYGKGYYDRLMKEMGSAVVKIGLNLSPCFDCFKFLEPHDEALDYCVTPFEIIDCKHV